HAVVDTRRVRMLGREPVVDRDHAHTLTLGEVAVAEVVQARRAEHHRPAVDVQVGAHRVRRIEHATGDAGEHLVAAVGRFLLKRGEVSTDTPDRIIRIDVARLTAVALVRGRGLRRGLYAQGFVLLGPQGHATNPVQTFRPEYARTCSSGVGSGGGAVSG